MKLKSIRRALYVCLMVGMSFAHAAPVPVLNLRQLVAEAEVVAMGTIASVEDRGPISIQTQSGSVEGRQMIARMTVDQMLKGGAADSALDFEFFLPDAPNGYRGVAQDSYRIVLLKQGENGYEVVSPHYPSVAAVPGAPIQGANPDERVMAAVARVLPSPMAPAQTKKEAIHTLWGIDHPVVLSGVRGGLTDADIAVRLTATAALLAVNDLTGWSFAEAALLRPGGDIDPVLLHNVRVGISQGVRQPAAVPGLTQLLAASDVLTRRAAAAALAQIDSQAAIRPLARALDDADFEVRLTAVRGLATLTGQQELTPSWDDFRQEEMRFIIPLRSWVIANIGLP